MSGSTLYERDFHAWAEQQARLLRTGQLAEADIAHIAEEIESMGRSEKRELVNRLAVLLTHLLRWRFQAGLRSTSWRLTIEEQRTRLADHLDDNPSLRAILPAALGQAWRLARLGAAQETGLERENFPPDLPWSFTEIANPAFWPDTAP